MEQTKAKNGFTEWFSKNWKTNPLFSTGLALIVMVIVQTLALGFNFNSFGSWFATWVNNWINLLRNNAVIGIIAMGMTFAIISGGIDLSVGSTFVAVGALTMMMLSTSGNGFLAAIGITGVPAIIIAIIIAIAFGTLLGEGNGVLVANGKLPPFIATLGTMQILRSVTQYFMQKKSTTAPTEYLSISNLTFGNLKLMPIIYWAIIVVVMYIVSKHTTFGRYVFAVGSNERTTSLSGINVKKVKRRVYALTGTLVAIASIIQTSRMGSMDYASAGSGYEMDAIAAVIVGGTNMAGGKGSVVGTVFGTLIVAVMNNLLNLIGVDPYLSTAFKGAIIIGAVLLQRKSN